MDRRVAHYWLDNAYTTGTMDYLNQILETPMDDNFSQQFNDLFDSITDNDAVHVGPSLAHLLMATHFPDLKVWNGKTSMGQPFYGEIKKEQSVPYFIEGEKETIFVISARPGHSDMVDKWLSYERDYYY